MPTCKIRPHLDGAGLVLDSTLVSLLRWILSGLALVIPLLGVWIASSMVALQGGPRNWAVAAGLLCFPVVPGIWAWWAASGRDRAPRLGRIGDLGLRTAVVNLLFVGGLLGLRPQVALVAVSTRGDWFLDETKADWTPGARTLVLAAAGGLAGLHELLVPNPYAPSAPEDSKGPTHPTAGKVVVLAPQTPVKTKRRVVGKRRPAPRSSPRRSPTPAPMPIAALRVLPELDLDPEPVEEPVPAESEAQGGLLLSNRDGALQWKTDAEMPKPGLSVLPAGPRTSVIRRRAPPPPPTSRSTGNGRLGWPLAGGAHRWSQDLPDSATESVEALATHIADLTPDPFIRVRVLHDWMATYIAYDDVGLRADNPPSYEPEQVLKNRKAVCAGYARLFGGVVKHWQLPSVYIIGRTRGMDASLSAQGHAWNAVQIQDAWFLVDVTWDATRYTSGRSEAYSTVHLWTPPEVLRITHLPNEPQWQLTEDTLTLGAFLRQPMTVPHFTAHGLVLLSPTRPHLNVHSRVDVRIDNPRGRYLSLTLEPVGSEGPKKHRPCAGPVASPEAHLSCTVPSGAHNLALWVGDAEHGRRVLSARWQVIRE